MPTEQEVQSYLSQLLPTNPQSLPRAERECPICFEPYLTQNHSPNQYTTNREHAVRIQSPKPNQHCRHVFGRKCIEAHFRSGGPWCVKCPTCREQWFEGSGLDDEYVDEWAREEDAMARAASAADSASRSHWETSEETDMSWASGTIGTGLETGLQDDAGFVRMQIPQLLRFRIHGMPELVNGQSSSQRHSPSASSTGTSASADDGVSRSPAVNMDFSNRGRVNRSIGVLEKVLMTAEIDGKGGNVDARVMEAERAIERLWASLADSVSLARNENGDPGTSFDIKDDGQDGTVRVLYA